MTIRSVFAVVGFLVIAMLLANASILHGDLCAGSLGCVGANDSGLRIHQETP